MGEIDDLYKAESEEIDSAFLEELKTSKDKKKSFENYRENLKKSREKFEKNYAKFNEAEKARIRNLTKRLAKEEEYKHLIIEHFNFEFTKWEKRKMRFNVSWFNFVRKIKRFFAWVFPNWFLYYWYKLRNIHRVTKRDFIEYFTLKKNEIKSYFVKRGLAIWKLLKAAWVWIKGLKGKILFWKKVEEKKEGEDEKDEKKEGDAEEEKKEEKSDV
jgi:hypothetical protein